MIIVFDLDDTLYDELDYVKCGFREVARFVERKYGLRQKDSYDFLIKREKARGRIFDDLLERNGLLSRTRVKELVAVYRGVHPPLMLYPDALRCIRRLKSLPLYVVTDGHKLVQQRKTQALLLNRFFLHVYRTNVHGMALAKPSTYCFKLIAKREGVPLSDLVCIGDNPAKDFVGLKPHGCLTVRLLRGHHKKVRLPKAFEAHVQIKNFDRVSVEWLEKQRKKFP